MFFTNLQSFVPCDDVFYPHPMASTPSDSVLVKGTVLTATLGAGSCIQPKLLFLSAGTGAESSGLKLQTGKGFCSSRKTQHQH